MTRILFLILILSILVACGDEKKKSSAGGDEEVLNSVLNIDSASGANITAAYRSSIEAALSFPMPVLRYQDSATTEQRTAEELALRDTAFTRFVRDLRTGSANRNEIFQVYPARESDMADAPGAIIANCYRVEMYNFTQNLTTTALADIRQQKLFAVNHSGQTQPEIPQHLKQLAIQLAINSTEVKEAYGKNPEAKDALMASTKTALNKTRCERSRHLCVAPTFVLNGKALWAITDLTDFKIVGVRWTSTGTTGPAAPLTERKLQDDKITACFCERETQLKRNGWSMNYMLTSSDGLRISSVSFYGKPVLQSAKLVDWHVSYSGTDGFGYSDAVGCPYFSQAAVIAYEVPQVSELKDESGRQIGFTLEQTFRSELWPTPCNYNYRQRYIFYNDGSFRVTAASIGRGCGNDGTYRPVFRIAFAEAGNFGVYGDKDSWDIWSTERWLDSKPTDRFTQEGYRYKYDQPNGGYFIEPSRGQFNDGGRGDKPFVYVTLNKANVDEGESDLVTIGPCCNTDYRQGPEKFIEPKPDPIANGKLVFWYVAELKNDDAKANEYCWAESVLEKGKYVAREYPCFAGPKFIPVKK